LILYNALKYGGAVSMIAPPFFGNEPVKIIVFVLFTSTATSD
jgi:hypothetical protein